MESQIINIIKINPTWKRKIADLKIKIKEDEDLAIFNYDIDADFSDSIVQEARGIIINIKTLEVCCWPFRKFMNVQETCADSIDWNNCQVEDKIDGSICKLWWRDGIGWYWSTNSCIDAFEAPLSADGTYTNFGELIESAHNYNDIPFNELDRDLTYIFELTSPHNQIVIRYPYTKLWHIGTRNNKTGEELRINIGIDQPGVYDIHTLDDCLSAANKLNDNSDIKKEGFVVVDKDWHRVKIKSPQYLALHHSWNNGNVNKEAILQLLIDNKNSIDDIVNVFPRIEVPIKYYYYKLAELKTAIQLFIDYTRSIYEEYNHDRKSVALQIKNLRLASFGFAALGNEYMAEDLIRKTPIKRLTIFIPDYQKKDFLSY